MFLHVSGSSGSRDFSLFLAKFLTTTATHLTTIPMFKNGMMIMKYVNNHPTRFDFQATAFNMGLIQMIFAVLFTFYNSIVLYTREDVRLTLCSYVTVVVLCEMPNYYYLAVSDDKNNALLELFQDENAPRVKNFNKDNPFEHRPGCLNKTQRVLFKTSRLLYVTSIYYFVPFLYLIIHQVLMIMANYNEEWFF